MIKFFIMIYSLSLAGKVEENTQKCTDMTTVANVFLLSKAQFQEFGENPKVSCLFDLLMLQLYTRELFHVR